jgi:hypothetical protein
VSFHGDFVRSAISLPPQFVVSFVLNEQVPKSPDAGGGCRISGFSQAWSGVSGLSQPHARKGVCRDQLPTLTLQKSQSKSSRPLTRRTHRGLARRAQNFRLGGRARSELLAFGAMCPCRAMLPAYRQRNTALTCPPQADQPLAMRANWHVSCITDRHVDIDNIRY